MPHFLDPDLPSAPDLPAACVDSPPSHRHGPRTEAVILTHRGAIDWPRLEAWLHRLRLGHAASLLRIKGLVRLDGATGPILIQGVHHVLHPPILLDRWPSEDRSTRLVLILRGADPAPIRAGWEALTDTIAPR